MDRPSRITQIIGKEIGASASQVAAAISLLDEGATVPFIARYRKEATGGLDDTQLRTLSDRLTYLRDLDERRDSIVKSIKDQGKLTAALLGALNSVKTKAQLEDIYLPFKPRRRTKASIARENGLEALRDAILANRGIDPEALAAGHLTDNVPGTREALEGARDILTEELSETAELIGDLRGYLHKEAVVSARLVPGKEEEGARFSDYFDHAEKWAGMPSHRALALMRAMKEGVLQFEVGPDPDQGRARCEQMVAARLGTSGTGPGDAWLRDVASRAWKSRLSSNMETELVADLRSRAQDDAISVFARNLKDLLLAAPAGAHATLGLDPGIRTGVKAAVIDATGKLIATDTLYPFQPKNDLRGAQARILDLIKRHGIELIAIGNGTASRETEKMVKGALAALPAKARKPATVVVSEAGASVYSASELAAKEFPELDVSLRGAVSIARRLQDPLAELVKIEPRSIGVGQYQHDVDQRQLGKALSAVVEDAVNLVGVDLNTASASLLSHVSGLTPVLAENIVNHRDQHGPFKSRRDLLKVSRLGPKAYEQCAGFLRIRGGKEPLDASAVHPESYPLARAIIAACGRDLRSIQSDPKALKALNPIEFISTGVGLPTVYDIFAELEKPGRDPRPSFRTANFADGVEDITDLKPGMRLEGTVTNVATFGAFVDIGVHQDGLVHVSQLADRFVKNPHEVVKAGDVVQVRVTEVDVARKRIALSMRSGTADTAAEATSRAKASHPKPSQLVRTQSGTATAGASPAQTGALGAALQAALGKR